MRDLEVQRTEIFNNYKLQIVFYTLASNNHSLLILTGFSLFHHP